MDGCFNLASRGTGADPCLTTAGEARFSCRLVTTCRHVPYDRKRAGGHWFTEQGASVTKQAPEERRTQCRSPFRGSHAAPGRCARLLSRSLPPQPRCCPCLPHPQASPPPPASCTHPDAPPGQHLLEMTRPSRPARPTLPTGRHTDRHHDRPFLHGWANLGTITRIRTTTPATTSADAAHTASPRS